MTINIKSYDKLYSIEAGTYILIFNPECTDIDELVKKLSMSETTEKIEIILIPSLNPESIRFLQAEKPVNPI